MGNNSATGVAFTRNPADGTKEFYGEVLINAQGEDVVAGIRTPSPISELKKKMPRIYSQLNGIRLKLEKHYRDMQDVEFTIQEGKLYLLQTRSGKRTIQAALKIATDMVYEGLISTEEALMRTLALREARSNLFRTIDILEPNLESVFIHLTGRELRD